MVAIDHLLDDNCDSDLYIDMFYQFIKFNLIGLKKDVYFKCLHFSESIFNEEDCKKKLREKFSITKINETNVSEIWMKYLMSSWN